MDLPEKLKNSKPNLNVLKDYRKREEEFLRRAQDLEQVTQLRDAKKQEYDSLRRQRLDEFMTGFSTISLKLKEMYQVSKTRNFFPLLVSDAYNIPSDDHSWRKRRTRVGGQHGPFLRGYHIQCNAAQEELEEHLKLVWWREGAILDYLVSLCIKVAYTALAP